MQAALVVRCRSGELVDELVTLKRIDRVGVITICNPPVNAIAPGVLEDIATCVSEACADDRIEAIVLIGAGRTFIAGADITKFGQSGGAPDIHGLLSQLEECPKPVVVAIHGTALGGGLEIAMAGHYRVAAPAAP